MEKKEDIGKSKNTSIDDFANYSYDTKELKVQDLLKKGFTKQHAEALVRKHKINKMFDDYPK